ncbi:MAG: hypothetical protein AUH80_04115 [Chloroflexi bacterium 13_1_40CM_4_65_16]|nr:MAG: hypothetical protein AUH80_04115 [Chloroflexi bacterium 13_1_40CM_4_65_16]
MDLKQPRWLKSTYPESRRKAFLFEFAHLQFARLISRDGALRLLGAAALVDGTLTIPGLPGTR